MRQRIVPPRVGDMTLLGGWLFADLLLALMVIFFASALGAPPPDIIPPPILTITPTTPLSPNNSPCTGGTTNATCTITLGESPLSKEEVDWNVSSGFGSQVTFSPPSGHLRPGDATTVTISGIPCQNDAFTFYDNSNRTNKAHAESILWKCTERLDFSFKSFTLTVKDVNALLSGSSQDNDIRQQVLSQPILKGRSVGLAIVSTGAPTLADTSQAQSVSAKIYAIFKTLNQPGQHFERASYYENLYVLNNPASMVFVDVYLFT